MSFTINLKRRIRVKSFFLEQGQHQELAELAIDVMKRRIAGGVNVSDQPASPLVKNYAKDKVRRGLAGIRDLRFTGAMLNDLAVLEASDVIRLGFRDPRQAQKAGVNESHEKMIGLSRFDQAQILNRHDELLASNVLNIITEVAELAA